MPELPEVETIKNDLKKAILGKKIARVEVRDKKAVENGLADFLRALKGNSFIGVDRVGKLLIFRLRRATIPPRRDAHANNNKKRSGKYLLIHLKLTGQLVYAPCRFTLEPPSTPSFVRRGSFRMKEKLNLPTPSLTRGQTPLSPLYKGGVITPPTPPLIKGRNKNQVIAGGPARQSPDGSRSTSLASEFTGGQAARIVAGGHPFPEVSARPTKFTRAVFRFSDGSELYFNDMRRFGYLKIVDGDELKKIEAEYGVDPLERDFKYENFRKIFENKKMSIKAVLMDQKLIAGIGNIYSDEILFAARVKPTRPANSLKESELKKIFFAIRPILKKAIRHRGTSFSDYVDGRGKKGNFISFLKIYGKKAGEKCPVCGGPVKAVKISGRTAKFCPRCQK